MTRYRFKLGLRLLIWVIAAVALASYMPVWGALLILFILITSPVDFRWWSQ